MNYQRLPTSWCHSSRLELLRDGLAGASSSGSRDCGLDRRSGCDETNRKHFEDFFYLFSVAFLHNFCSVLAKNEMLPPFSPNKKQFPFKFLSRNPLVIGRCLAAVHIIPPIARKLFLIENGAVGAQKGGALMAFAAVVAHVIRLAAGLRVGIHAGHGRHAAAMEAGRRHLVVDGVIVARHAGDFVQVLVVALGLIVVGRLDGVV